MDEVKEIRSILITMSEVGKPEFKIEGMWSRKECNRITPKLHKAIKLLKRDYKRMIENKILEEEAKKKQIEMEEKRLTQLAKARELLKENRLKAKEVKANVTTK